jgi:transposase-like protein
LSLQTGGSVSAVQVNFRISLEEKRLIREIARRLERREGDTLRYLVRRAAHEHGIIQPDQPPTPPAASAQQKQAA